MKRHVIIIQIEGASITDPEKAVQEITEEMGWCINVGGEIKSIAITETHPEHKLLWPDSDEQRAAFQRGIEQGKAFQKSQQ